MLVRLTDKEFINRSKKIHSDKYDYSVVNYLNIDTKVKIICPIHGEFEQIPYHHLNGHGCTECTGRRKFNTERFIIESNKVHNNKYDYSLVEYKNNNTKVKIICHIHGEFEQIPHSHLYGKGCKKCGNNTKKTQEDFIKESNKIHNNKYDYSLVEYKNNNTKVKIICPEHGIFLKIPKCHIHNLSGCPICKSSKGEMKVLNFLIDNEIKYNREQSFDGCRYKQPLRFDFYLSKYNTCIEYDGSQHEFRFGNEKGNEILEIRKIRDDIKNKYCKDNNINLIRISYKENIYDKLKFIKTIL